MANSPIYNWPEPDNTDLVKNGALAIRTLGDAIDTTMGTMVAKTVVDAKGDLIAGTAADTVNRLAVGNNGETLVADSSTSTGLRWQADFNIGRNKIINGFFDFWQRGTSFTAGALAYGADRFWSYQDGTGVATISRQTFSPQDDQDYFLRYSLSSLGTTTSAQIGTRIENVSTLAGKTATFSNYIKADSSRSNLISVFAEQNFGSGGSATVYTNLGTFSVTNAFTRPTLTASIPSVSGKTIGAGSYLSIFFQFTPATSLVLDTYAWQLEEGSVATKAVRCAGTIQGELAACQRYFQIYPTGSDAQAWSGQFYSTTAARLYKDLPVIMRTSSQSVTVPTGTFTNFIEQVGVATRTPTALTAGSALANRVYFDATGMSSATSGAMAVWAVSNSISISAEL